jgi:hypothetical protein
MKTAQIEQLKEHLNTKNMTNKNLVNSIDQLADKLREKREIAVSRLFWNYHKHIAKRLLIVTGTIVGYFITISFIAILFLRYITRS